MGAEFPEIGFFGIGSTAKALLSLPEIKRKRIVLRSDRAIDRNAVPKDIEKCKIYEGGRAFCDLSERVLVLSPSVRRDREEFVRAEKSDVLLTSDTDLFFERVEAPVFAISGSDGKSTTTARVFELLKRCFKAPVLCGNIGAAMLPELSCGDAFAAELSSFQLQYAKPAVRRAGITNITENHLDWHKNFDEYVSAKLSLLGGADEYALNADDPILSRVVAKSGAYGVFSTQRTFAELKEHYSAEAFYTLEGGSICRNGTALFPAAKVRLRQEHNVKNLLLSFAVCDGFVSPGDLAEVAASFRGLEHRCELFFSRGGVDFINSSIDTTPERTAQTLRSLGRRVVIILCGRGKRLSYTPLVPVLKKYARLAVVTGECRSEVQAALSGNVDMKFTDSFEEAVRLAACEAVAGEAVLLSPSATGYDVFKSFAERGKAFKEFVRDYYKNR